MIIFKSILENSKSVTFFSTVVIEFLRWTIVIMMKIMMMSIRTMMMVEKSGVAWSHTSHSEMHSSATLRQRGDL